MNWLQKLWYSLVGHEHQWDELASTYNRMRQCRICGQVDWLK